MITLASSHIVTHTSSGLRHAVSNMAEVVSRRKINRMGMEGRVKNLKKL